MSIPSEENLEARVIFRVHPLLTIDVSLKLSFEAGILFGPSGAGKTTLLRLISGLTRPDAGCVRLGGQILFDSKTRINEPLRSRRIGMIFQDDRLFPHLSVAANIGFGLQELGRSAARLRVAEVAALCGVETLLGRMPAMLSGGERQRVGLARALAPRPNLLLCDEPVSALDLANRHMLLEQLRNVQRSLAIPMLYVTHNPAEALIVGSRLFLLEEGRIIAEGNPLDALSKNGSSHVGSNAWADFPNVFTARVVEHAQPDGASLLELEGGPQLVVPFLNRPSCTTLLVAVRADDILIAKEPITGMSARNQIPGVVDRVVRHGRDAEVIVKTGRVTWIISVVVSAVEQLSLVAGDRIHLIIKARSCHVLDAEYTPPRI